MARPRSPWLAGALAVLALGVLVQLSHALTGTGPAAPIEDDLYMATEMGAALVCLWRAVAVRAERLAWSLMAAYLLLWGVADGLWVWVLDEDTAPIPNVSDAFFLGSYVAAYAGQVVLLRARLRPFRPSQWLDGLVVGLGLSAASAVAFAPILELTDGAPLTVGTTLAYPALDLLLLTTVAVAFAMTGWRPGATWTLLGASLVLTALADGLWSLMESADSYEAGTLVDVMWPASMLCAAIAAWTPARRRRADDDGLVGAILPAGFGLASLAVLVVAAVGDVTPVASGLAALALLAAFARAGLTYRENLALLRHSRAEALTDGLSGLGNRRRLMDDLDDALAHREPTVLGFFDLDGFKAYNDSFGHGAGDVLLRRLGRELDAAVAGHGRAYRLGGDEFCVLLRGDDEALVAGASRALTAEGDGFAIGASCGAVVLPRDAGSATVALQLADERMYAAKASRRGSTRRQARDLLLQVLVEREPDLREHLGGVAALALAAGRRLGLDNEQLDEVVRGAELHDVGKVAVPDGILGKPGPLDDEEWAIMRQHTIVGERILAAAPALRPVAALVRASHERWDGGGYPDGLAGEAIPLGARIITACDAYDAMRADRPYARPVTVEAALAELRRCAGTQFDPRVVEAVVAAVREVERVAA
ncbi:MAG: diguanylate cyclase [Solirubrobacterales bacterium]|nr:diguanylate cyclase [Solirubrobacterales bacterium]